MDIADVGKGEDTVSVVRYWGAQKIKEMIDGDHYIEAFVHAQLNIEQILWDRVVTVFEGEKRMEVRRTIDQKNKKSGRKTGTAELIKWAHILGAINDAEFAELTDFNQKRNDLMHGHGRWFYSDSQHREALLKASRFLENNRRL